MDADVDANDTDDDTDDAGKFSIANEYESEDEYALTDKEKDLSAVRTKRTAARTSQQRSFYWLAKQLSASFKTLLQMQ